MIPCAHQAYQYDITLTALLSFSSPEQLQTPEKTQRKLLSPCLLCRAQLPVQERNLKNAKPNSTCHLEAHISSSQRKSSWSTTTKKRPASNIKKAKGGARTCGQRTAQSPPENACPRPSAAAAASATRSAPTHAPPARRGPPATAQPPLRCKPGLATSFSAKPIEGQASISQATLVHFWPQLCC